MEIHPEKDVVNCIECCECAVPVGTDGPQRAALLLPCQHVMHLSCMEFVKRHMKLKKMYDETKPTSLLLEEMVCPGCREPVQCAIPLFTTSEVLSQPSSDEEAAKRDFERIHHAQKRYLKRVHRTLQLKANVMQISRECAALHIQRTAFLRDVEQHNRLFPARKGIGTGACASGSLASLSFSNMSTTELELYLTQTIPVLNQTQTALLEKRRAVEKHKHALLALKEKYHARKKEVRLAKDRVLTPLAIQKPNTSLTPQPATFEKAAVESTGRVSLSPANEAASRTSMHSSRSLDKDVFFVDVDLESTAMRREDNRVKRRSNSQRSSSSYHPRQQHKQTVFDAVVVSSSEEGEEEDSTGVVECGEGISTNTFTNNHRLAEVDNDQEITSAMFFPRWVGGRDMKREMQVRQLQLLPRRENYLWQSSLPF